LGATTVPFGASRGFGEVSDFELSGDGSTVEFITAQALVPSDVNGGFDVYEWRNGALHLVTDGLSDAQGNSAAPGVIGVDDDGSNVFFAVAQPGLTGFEQDRLLNFYDARIGGGFEPPTPPVHCEGDSCQGQMQPPPDVEPVASSTFNGHGNVVEPKSRCPKRKVRRHGRCVSRHSHKQRARHKPHTRKAETGRNAGRTK
jgi:hypothetical protein